MNTVLLVIQAMTAIAMVIVILIQRSSSDGLGGLGGGSSNAFLSGRASANLLTRTTAILATIFLINSLVLATIASRGNHRESLIESIEKNGADQAPAGKAPKAEEKPTSPSVPIAE